jgi:hypothetical protein
MSKGGDGVPWPIWALVTILVAVISAYSVIKVAEYANRDKAQSTSNQPSPTPAEKTPSPPNTNTSPPPKPNVQMSQDEVGYDRPGSDYGNGFIVSDVRECGNICLKDTKCQSFSFRQSSKQCWLKNAAPLRVDDPDFISGVKLEY